MRAVNIQHAKTHLSRLVEDAAAGEEIIIAKAGRARAKLVACPPAAEPRTLGAWEGRLEIAADFDETPEEIVDLFERGEQRGRPRRGRR
jgi:antitoxin (DNA-binding transcriptional repressor) of toxin-antitoxin stability system